MRPKSSKRKIFIIYDQRAHSDGILQADTDRIRRLGHDVVLKLIANPRDVARYAGEAVDQSADTVVAVGGDGMLNLVVNGLIKNRSEVPCAVGLVPYGTGNDFAEAAGIPAEDVSAALDIVLRARPVPIDVGQLDEAFFVNVVVGGFPAEATAEISKTMKEILGKFAYLLTGLASIGNLTAKKVSFAAPGFSWEGLIYAFGIGNGRQAGGGFKVAPKALVNDGMIDLMIMPQSDEGLLTLISEYSRSITLDDTERIIYAQLPWVNLRSPETMHLNLDGEPTEGSTFKFGVHKGRLPFYLPEHSPLLKPPADRN